LELNAKKIVDEAARRSHEFAANMHRNNRGTNNRTNSNGDNSDNSDNGDNGDGNNANDTTFGSTFSNINMKINVDLSEYKEKMKRYYENPRC
jgi:hypothetical protein